MNLGILGKGKTGGKLIELVRERYPQWPITIYDRTHRPTLKDLSQHDVIISFLPGEAFASYFEILIESKVPVVTGSTGLNWPENFAKGLKAPWLFATNFSLGMNLVHQMILTLNRAQRLFDNYSFDIHEIHHTKKLDAPSGTALSWNKWVDNQASITHERIGDVVGDHQINLVTPFEKISIRHQALDRKIFAAGALWAAEKIKTLPVGLHDFQDITRKELLENS